MMDLLIISAITSVLLIGISWVYHRKKSPLKFIIPLTFLLISIAAIILSFFAGEWTGLGLGMLAFAVFIGSAIALIVTAMISSTSELRKLIK
ncbi:YesK family protein [Virgibacillus sp. C22-A2]|uniref:YesK family protein n=1 Tax=Virgibacillus tibetensis TaxID=3042313 RepID=A0ABU6KKN2_9BACI|nr:YesK family protein [Virgibacillus sp. C22-A2]